MSAPFQPPAAFDADRIQDALNYLDPTDRDPWLRIGMAIHSDQGDAGFDLWNSWSQRAETYDARDARDVWKSFKAGGGIRIGTLFAAAKAAGWRDEIAYQTITPEERAARERTKAERVAAAHAETARKHAEAVAKAVAVLNAATPAKPDHPYLVRKHVAPAATLYEIDAAGAGKLLGYAANSSGEPLVGRLLVVPVNVDDKLSTLEFIDETGRKTALAGGRKSGGYWPAQPLPDGDGTGLTLLVGEGVATVLSASEATGHPSVAALSCSNLPAVAKAMRARYPKGTLGVLADLGNGQRDAADAARAAGAFLALPDFGPDRPADATDFNDLAALRGLEAVRHAIAKALQAGTLSREPGSDDEPLADPVAVRVLLEQCGIGVEPAAQATREPVKNDHRDRPSRFVMISDFCRYPPEENWLIEHYIEPDSLSVMYGDSEAFKSFLAIDLACHIATGRPWRGQAVEKGFALYVAGEGANGLKKRFRAWFEYYGLPMQNIAVTTAPIALCDPANTQLLVDDILALVKRLGTMPAFIELDTLNTHFGGGDENSTADMTRFLDGMRRLRIATNAHVQTTHHCGHADKTRGRGSIVLRNGIDWEYRVERQPETPFTTMTCTKSRDADRPPPLSWELFPVALPWADKKGKPMSCPVLRPLDAVPAREEPLSPKQREALGILKQLHQTARDNLSAGGHDPAGARVTIAEWQEAMKTISPYSGNRSRIRDALVDTKSVKFEGIFVWLC